MDQSQLSRTTNFTAAPLNRASRRGRNEFGDECRRAREVPLPNLVHHVGLETGTGRHPNSCVFMDIVEGNPMARGVKLPGKRKSLLANQNDCANAVVSSLYKPRKIAPDPLRDPYEITGRGERVLVANQGRAETPQLVTFSAATGMGRKDIDCWRGGASYAGCLV